MYYDCGGEWGPVTFPAFKAADEVVLRPEHSCNTLQTIPFRYSVIVRNCASLRQNAK